MGIRRGSAKPDSAVGPCPDLLSGTGNESWVDLTLSYLLTKRPGDGHEKQPACTDCSLCSFRLSGHQSAESTPKSARAQGRSGNTGQSAQGAVLDCRTRAACRALALSRSPDRLIAGSSIGDPVRSAGSSTISGQCGRHDSSKSTPSRKIQGR